MKKIGMILLFAFLPACASQPVQTTDAKADAALGIAHEDQDHEVAQNLDEIRREKIDEAQDSLQRQINDPIHY